jgi:hypothetical protein
VKRARVADHARQRAVAGPEKVAVIETHVPVVFEAEFIKI